MKIAVVIPCYKVKKHIVPLIEKIGAEVSKIYLVDDKCPEESVLYAKSKISDSRISYIFHEKNKGVGGAVITGYKQAINGGAEIIVKIDGDGQMNPALINSFVRPIINGEADYTKGNRFYDLEKLRKMPARRLVGNAILSFFSKLSTGYWNLFDPTNGYTAIHAKVVSRLPLDKISERYFFESDILFRLNTLNACVLDIPMEAVYADEESNLHIRDVFIQFLTGNCKNFVKRIFYNYYLRNFTVSSIQLVTGSLLLLFGLTYGTLKWLVSEATSEPATAGTVMLAALPVIVGLQMLISFIDHDISSTPKNAIHKRLS